MADCSSSSAILRLAEFQSWVNAITSSRDVITFAPIRTWRSSYSSHLSVDAIYGVQRCPKQ